LVGAHKEYVNNGIAFYFLWSRRKKLQYFMLRKNIMHVFVWQCVKLSYVTLLRLKPEHRYSLDAFPVGRCLLLILCVSDNLT